MFDFLNMADNYEDRRVDRWESEDESQMLSTAAVSDARQPFETAVMHPRFNNGSMVVVQAYDTKEDAQKGHNKWLKLILENHLPTVLSDCGNSEISQYCEKIGCAMNFEIGPKPAVEPGNRRE